MAEYINKTDFLKVVNNACTEDERKFIEALTKGYVETIDIVHCSECKWRGTQDEELSKMFAHYCRQISRLVDDDYFCSFGERKE